MEKLNYGNEVPKKSKKGLLLVIAIILVLLLAAFGGLYFYNKPKATFLRYIDKMVNGDQEEMADFKTYKADLKLEGSIKEAKDDEINQINDILEKSKLALNVGVDKENKKETIGVKIDYDNQNMIDLLGHIDINNKKSYIYVKDLFDKYFEVSMEEDTKELSEALESLTTAQNINVKKANSILKQEIKTQLEEKYFTSERTKIDVNEKEVSAVKSTLTLTATEAKEIAKRILTNLANNEEFVNCYEENANIKEYLEEMVTSIDNIEIEETVKFDISIYTTGLFAKFAILDIVVKDEEANEEYDIEIIKNSEEEIAFNVNATLEGRANVNACNGIIKIIKNADDEYDIEFTADVIEVGIINIKMYVKQETDVALDEVDTTNSVNIENLTEDDYVTIMTNLQEMPLGVLLTTFLETSISDLDNSL